LSVESDGVKRTVSTAPITGSCWKVDDYDDHNDLHRILSSANSESCKKLETMVEINAESDGFFNGKLMTSIFLNNSFEHLKVNSLKQSRTEAIRYS
jgi:hypothetical protein